MRKTLYLFLILFFIRCSEFEKIDGIQFRQYADSIIDYSSEYLPSPQNWSTSRVLGRENVFPAYGDNTNAWSPSTADSNREFLVVGFDTVQTIRIIEIYETWHAGAIDSVSIRNAQTKAWEKVYSKPAITGLPEQSRKFTIFLALETTYLVDAIRIAMNSPAIESWNEIDAIAITGQRSKQE